MSMELQITAVFGDIRVLTEELHAAYAARSTVTIPNDLVLTVFSEERHHIVKQAMDNKEVKSLRITPNDLERLIREAQAFGSLLNDAENEMNSIYALTPAPWPNQPFFARGS